MRTFLHLFTEEGRTRSRNAFSRCVLGAIIACVICGGVARRIHKYWTPGNLTALQRAYFDQYLKSSYRSYLPNSMSRYTTFSRVVTDAKTEKDTSLAVHDDQVVPVLDEAGHIQLDKNHYPVILLREGIEHKQFRRDPITTLDTQAYEWFNQHIYGGKSIHSVFAMLAHGENKADLDRFGTPTAVRVTTLGRIGRSSDNRALRNRATHRHQKAMSCASAAVGLFPSYVMTIDRTPASTDSPLRPLRSPARALARLTSLTPPLGAGALLVALASVAIFSPEVQFLGFQAMPIGRLAVCSNP